MPHRILFCTIGTSPQVVTETVWALMTRAAAEGGPWIPDEYIIITTADSRALPVVQEKLQAADGMLARLIGGPPNMTIYVPRRGGSYDAYPAFRSEAVNTILSGGAPDGPPLLDIETKDDALLMGAVILSTLRNAVKVHDSEVHVSLAGGRKTMSSHALSALALVGRFDRDEASQVLVSGPGSESPSPFELNRDFWFPTQHGELLSFDNKIKLNPIDARVNLVVIPVVFLRNRVKNFAAIESLDIVEVARQIQHLNEQIENPFIVLHRLTNTVDVGGKSFKLGPKVFSLFRLFATAAAERWIGSEPEGGDPSFGWLTTEYMVTAMLEDGVKVSERMGEFIRDALVADGKELESDPSFGEEKTIWEKWRDGVINAASPTTATINANYSFGANYNHMDEAIVDAFGADAATFLRLSKIGRDPVHRRMSSLYASQAIRIEN